MCIDSPRFCGIFICEFAYSYNFAKNDSFLDTMDFLSSVFEIQTDVPTAINEGNLNMEQK